MGSPRYTLSSQRPLPPIEMHTPCALSAQADASEVNCDPWSVLKTLGAP